MDEVPQRFRPAWAAVAALEADERYLAALVFGSVAEGRATDASDLDVRVVIAGEDSCREISHPRIGGVKLDVTFQSLAQVQEQMEAEVRLGERRPMIAGGRIVFDRTGGLTALLARADSIIAPPPSSPASARMDAFMLYHASDKASRALEEDPTCALYSMHATIGEVLAIHYRAQGRFKVSSKRMLADLDSWDAEAAGLVRAFVTTCDPGPKHEAFSRVVDHVSRPFGGMVPIEELSCGCESCLAGVADLLAGAPASPRSLLSPAPSGLPQAGPRGPIQ